MLQLDKEIRRLKEQYEACSLQKELKSEFADFPLSQKTLKGLTEANFVSATEIQKECILPALMGRNVVGVAETGSGKTLAFLIPVLEHLFMNKWSRGNGLAALIISPTRELAFQIFETIRKIGKYHDFSAGLIIGGKNLHFEKNRLNQCNILIGTPGRLLQHMDENPYFHVDTMELLVLDEADRCLDMGFEACLNAIIKNLPLERQTLLFSATHTKTNEYISRLNLKNPVYAGRYWQDRNLVVPERLKQNYVVVQLESKLSMLWSFIMNHLKQKILVFMSSCKQVKYVYEVFCKLRPGIGLLALYGTLNQDRRISIYNEFFKRNHVVLFATDIASRGLDFPGVNWILQLDCPEDVTQYLHRAGRCARNKSHGENLLILMPSEETPMLKELNTQNIILNKVEIDPKKLFSIEGKLKSFCARSPELKVSAQRAFIAYIKSVFLMKNKNIFNVNSLNLEKFAESLGLITTPRIRFLERHLKKESKNYMEQNIGDTQEDDFLSIKRIDHEISCEDTKQENQDECNKTKLTKRKITKAVIAKKSVRKNMIVNKKCRYDEDGNEIYVGSEGPNLEMSNSPNNLNGLNIYNAKNYLIEEDKKDKVRFQEIIKMRRKKLKEKRISKELDTSESKTCLTKETKKSLPLAPDAVYKSRAVKESNFTSPTRDEHLTKYLKSAESSLKDTENIASLLLSLT